MELETIKGKLDLPKEFGMTMERTNPFLCNEGDASVPVTLASSPHNLSLLGHRERIDRAYPYTNKVDAVLTTGIVQKQGRLVIDTAHRRNGIVASFAIDNGDLYAKSKEKTLRAIFEEANGGQGVTWTFTDINEAANAMNALYNGLWQNDAQDFAVFPVAVSPYKTESTTSYGDTVTNEVFQYNNEIDPKTGLVWQQRTVREGDIEGMTVPDGYGLAPFMKLYKMINHLFACLGYTVTENCFAVSPLKDLVVLHNCSDALVTRVLHYADLVPTCTLSEFLDWLLAKFHAQPVVDSNSRTAKVLLAEDLLDATPDADLTGKVEGDWTVELQTSRRVVLTPSGMTAGDDGDDTGYDGGADATLEQRTAPAARTLNGLVKKYGTYYELDEKQFYAKLNSGVSALVLRKATGTFYEFLTNLNPDIETAPKPIGTNHFCYDRYNSEEEEAYSQTDTVPLMTAPKLNDQYLHWELGLRVTPYIGERKHRRTRYENRDNDASQSIMVAWATTSEHYYYKTTGTTQDNVPFTEEVDGAWSNSLPFSLTNYAMYARFWKKYNEQMLNQSPKAKARVLLGIGEFMNMDMSRPKLCSGQLLLPERAKARVADRTGLTEMELRMMKHYADGKEDEEIAPSEWPAHGLCWEVTGNNLSSASADLVAETILEAAVAHPGMIVGGTESHIGEVENVGVYLGPPSAPGETVTLHRKGVVYIDLRLYTAEDWENYQTGHTNPGYPYGYYTPYQKTFKGVNLTFTLEALSY